MEGPSTKLALLYIAIMSMKYKKNMKNFPVPGPLVQRQINKT